MSVFTIAVREYLSQASDNSILKMEGMPASGGSGSGSSRPRPTSSGDNTTRSPASLQYSLSTITEDATAIANDPAKLLHGLDKHYSAFNIIDNLPKDIKAEIIREAESSSPLVEPVHHQLPQKQTLPSSVGWAWQPFGLLKL